MFCHDLKLSLLGLGFIWFIRLTRLLRLALGILLVFGHQVAVNRTHDEGVLGFGANHNPVLGPADEPVAIVGGGDDRYRITFIVVANSFRIRFLSSSLRI